MSKYTAVTNARFPSCLTHRVHDLKHLVLSESLYGPKEVSCDLLSILVLFYSVNDAHV